jgi:hypothetical protein
MEDSKERFIEAAIRPFADNAEMKLAAANFLETQLDADADDAAAMAARWDEVDGTRKRRTRWRRGLWAAVVVSIFAMVLADLYEISRYSKWMGWVAALNLFHPMPEEPVERIASRLNEADRRLLFGDLTQTGKAERKEGSWRSEPWNPAYFADYAAAFASEYGKLPPDFLETARRIDPRNAWFTYFAAAVEAIDAVKQSRRKSKRVDGKIVFEEPVTWTIVDQGRMDRSMELLRMAREQPEYEDYRAELLRKWLPLLPQQTLIEHLDSASALGSTSTFSSFQFRNLTNAIAARAQVLGESGDLLGFQELTGDGESLLRRNCNDENLTLVDGLMRAVMASGLAGGFAQPAEKLGLHEESARWKSIEQRVAESNQERGNRPFIVDGQPVERETKSGGLAGSVELVARFSEQQPPVSDKDLEPMRRVSHDLTSRFLGYVSWGVMALCLGFVACYRYRVAMLSRRLAVRMGDLLDWTDWLWIIAAGVMAPFAYVMVINRLTPLGGLDFAISGTALLMPTGHFLGLWMLWLVVPVQVVRWRMAIRAGRLGFSRPSWVGWLAVGCAVAFVPMIGWAAVSRSFADLWLEWVAELGVGVAAAPGLPWRLWTALGLAAMAVIWQLVAISFTLLGRTDRQLHWAAFSRVLMPVHATILLVLVFAIFGFRASERYWFRQDTLSKFDLASPGWTIYESRVAEQMRKELRTILGYESGPLQK